jgi:hypothetical protein
MPSQVRARAALTLSPLSVNSLHAVRVVCSHDKHTTTLASLAGMLRVMRRIAHPSHAHRALQCVHACITFCLTCECTAIRLPLSFNRAQPLCDTSHTVIQYRKPASHCMHAECSHACILHGHSSQLTVASQVTANCSHKPIKPSISNPIVSVDSRQSPPTAHTNPSNHPSLTPSSQLTVASHRQLLTQTHQTIHL